MHLLDADVVASFERLLRACRPARPDVPSKRSSTTYFTGWAGPTTCRKQSRPFSRRASEDGSLLPGRSYDNISALLEDAEGYAHQ